MLLFGTLLSTRCFSRRCSFLSFARPFAPLNLHIPYAFRFLMLFGVPCALLKGLFGSFQAQAGIDLSQWIPVTQTVTSNPLLCKRIHVRQRHSSKLSWFQAAGANGSRFVSRRCDLNKRYPKGQPLGSWFFYFKIPIQAK